eukprot:g2375.t1
MRPLGGGCMLMLGSIIIVAAVAAGEEGRRHALRAAAVEKLKTELHTLTPAETEARFAELGKLRRSSPPPHQSKIDHFVVLLMENHAADQLLGCMDLPGFDGIDTKEGRRLPKDPDDPGRGFVTARCDPKTPYVCKQGPAYSNFRGKFKPGANAGTYP